MQFHILEIPNIAETILKIVKKSMDFRVDSGSDEIKRKSKVAKTKKIKGEKRTYCKLYKFIFSSKN